MEIIQRADGWWKSVEEHDEIHSWTLGWSSSKLKRVPDVIKERDDSYIKLGGTTENFVPSVLCTRDFYI